MRPLVVHNAVPQSFLDHLIEIPIEWKRAQINNEAVSTVRRCWAESMSSNSLVEAVVKPLFEYYENVETNNKFESQLILYREEDAGNYDLHQDVFYSQDDVRKLSMSILITDDFTGGELEIMGEVMEIQKGDAVIFPSFLPHSVTPVKTGSRLSLVSWLYGPHWK